VQFAKAEKGTMSTFLSVPVPHLPLNTTTRKMKNEDRFKHSATKKKMYKLLLAKSSNSFFANKKKKRASERERKEDLKPSTKQIQQQKF